MWPRSTKEAEGIARTSFANHCYCVDVLMVRGRRLSCHDACFSVNRVSEDVLWNLSKLGLPYLVYKGGNDGTGGGDLAPGWLGDWCVYRGVI